MIKDPAIKWHAGEVTQAMDAAATLAEVMIRAGKYAQAFSPNWCNRPRSPGIAFNRLSTTPIKLHSQVDEVQLDIFLDMRPLKTIDIKEGSTEETIYILNTSLEAEYIKEKFNLENNKVITVDPGEIVPDYLPLMATAVHETGMLELETFLEILSGILSEDMGSEKVSEEIKQIEQLLTEVKEE